MAEQGRDRRLGELKGAQRVLAPVAGEAFFADLEERRGLVAAGVVVGSSRVDLQACKLEYSIVSPK